MARIGGSTTLWRYVAYSCGGVFSLEPIVAETAGEALQLAKEGLDASELANLALRTETLSRILCSTDHCLGYAATDRAGRYLCDACAAWFSPALF